MVITRVCRRWEQVCGGNLTVDFDFGWRVFGSVQRERLSNRILVTVARRFHGIRVLRLSGCQRPTPSGMMEALRASRAGLVTLDLSGCAWTVATNLEPTLARFGASLQTLVLVGCPGTRREPRLATLVCCFDRAHAAQQHRMGAFAVPCPIRVKSQHIAAYHHSGVTAG